MIRQKKGLELSQNFESDTTKEGHGGKTSRAALESPDIRVQGEGEASQGGCVAMCLLLQ